MLRKLKWRNFVTLTPGVYICEDVAFFTGCQSFFTGFMTSISKSCESRERFTSSQILWSSSLASLNDFNVTLQIVGFQEYTSVPVPAKQSSINLYKMTNNFEYWPLFVVKILSLPESPVVTVACFCREHSLLFRVIRIRQYYGTISRKFHSCSLRRVYKNLKPLTSLNFYCECCIADKYTTSCHRYQLSVHVRLLNLFWCMSQLDNK